MESVGRRLKEMYLKGEGTRVQAASAGNATDRAEGHLKKDMEKNGNR